MCKFPAWNHINWKLTQFVCLAASGCLGSGEKGGDC